MNHAVQWSDLWPSSIACAVQSPRSFAFSLLSSTALLNTLQKFSCVLWIGWNIGSFSITDGFSPNGLPFQLVQPLHPSRPLLLLSSCLDHIIRIWTRKNKKLKVGWFYLFFFSFRMAGQKNTPSNGIWRLYWISYATHQSRFVCQRVHCMKHMLHGRMMLFLIIYIDECNLESLHEPEKGIHPNRVIENRKQTLLKGVAGFCRFRTCSNEPGLHPSTPADAKNGL